MEILTRPNIELMGNLPYRPDLAVFEFCLFLHIKNELCSQRFSTPKNDGVKTLLLKLPELKCKSD